MSLGGLLIYSKLITSCKTHIIGIINEIKIKFQQTHFIKRAGRIETREFNFFKLSKQCRAQQNISLMIGIIKTRSRPRLLIRALYIRWAMFHCLVISLHSTFTAKTSFFDLYILFANFFLLAHFFWCVLLYFYNHSHFHGNF